MRELERERQNGTVSQTDGGFLGVDVKEEALVADFGFGNQADEAADVGIGGRTGISGVPCHFWVGNTESSS